MMFVLFTRLMLWDRNFKYQHQTLKTEIFWLHFLGLFYEFKAFFFSFFSFAFFFSFKFGLMCGRNAGSRYFAFYKPKTEFKFGFQTRIRVRLKKKERELWIELRIVTCKLWEWELSFENWDMDVLRTKHSINFQIFYHSCICPIWALN